MGKIVLLIFLIIILFFPIYENSKIKNIIVKEVKKNIPISTILEANFFVYEGNLTKKGNFNRLDIYKNFYLVKEIFVSDLEKGEKLSAKEAEFKEHLLKFVDFKYKNNEYNLISDNVIYDMDLKVIKGNKFFLYSKDYNGSGYSFFIDKNKNIKAKNIEFYVRINE